MDTSDNNIINPGGLVGSDVYGPPVARSDNPPQTLIYHLLDGNVVFQEPIYDYSHYPYQIIGYRITSYSGDKVSVDLVEYILPSDALQWISTIDDILSLSVKAGAKGLGEIGEIVIGLGCPECSIILNIASEIDSLNNAIFIEGHLRTHYVYFTGPPKWLHDPLYNPSYLPDNKR